MLSNVDMILFNDFSFVYHEELIDLSACICNDLSSEVEL